jgi:hypothetical protein
MLLKSVPPWAEKEAMDRVTRLFPDPTAGNNTGSMRDRLAGAIVEVCFLHMFKGVTDVADVCSEGEFIWKGKLLDIKSWQTNYLTDNPNYYLSVEYAPRQRHLVDRFKGHYLWAAINTEWTKIAWYGGMSADKFKKLAVFRPAGTRLHNGPKLKQDQLVIQVKDLYER